MHKVLCFAAAAGKSADRTLAIPASCPVKPSQTQSNHFLQEPNGALECWSSVNFSKFQFPAPDREMNDK
jgi:hypothetical protein